MKAFILTQLGILSHAKRQFSLLVWPSSQFFWTTSLWVAVILTALGCASTFILDPTAETLVLWLKSRI